MSQISAELDKKKQAEAKAASAAIVMPTPAPATGVARALSSVFNILTGPLNTPALASATHSSTQPTIPFTFTAHTSSSPNDLEENSPRTVLSGATEKSKSDSTSPSPTSAKPAAIGAGAAAADGNNTKSSTPNSSGSFEHVTHSGTHSPETLHHAPPINVVGETSPLLVNASGSTQVQTTLRSNPGSGTSSPDLTSLSMGRKQSIPPIPNQALPPPHPKSETQAISKYLEEISTLKAQLSHKDQLLVQQEFTINKLQGTIEQHRKEDRSRVEALIYTPPNVDNQLMQEQYANLQSDLKLLTDRNTALESDLAATKKALSLAREANMKQYEDEVNSPVYQRGFLAGVAREAARVLEAQQAADIAEQRRLAAHQAAEAARTAQATAAAAHANAVKQAADAAAQLATAAAAAETERKQSFMRGK
jgi:hypothetical protein